MSTVVLKDATSRITIRQATAEPLWLKVLLTTLALSFLTLFLLLPLVIVFGEAFAKGWQVYVASITEPAAAHAIKLTLLAAAIAVPCNVIFGLGASWAIAKFQFRGKQLLITLIDLPIAVSPVIAGLCFMLLFGARGWWGEWLNDHDFAVMFAVPGIVLATIFITFPFVARELIPLMQEQGREQEEAALTLGASGWQTFRLVTLPSIKWALLYGIILCNARAMGEFGAVLVAVVHHMGLVAPGGHAGGLHHGAHGAAMVGAVEQQLLDDRRVGGCPARAGIGPREPSLLATPARLPRASGDRPCRCVDTAASASVAPRERG